MTNRTKLSPVGVRHPSLIAVAGMLVAGLGASAASAATYTWTPTATGSYNWNNASAQNNWSSGFPNAMSDVANVTSNAAGAQTINLNQAITIGVLNIGDTNNSHAFTIAPNAGSLTFNNDASNAEINVASTSKGDVISADVTLTSNLAVTQNSTANAFTMSGAISGAGTLTKSGAGSLVLSGGNSYAGTTIDAGTLSAQNPANTNVLTSLGTGTINLNAGTLALRANGTGNSQSITTGNGTTTPNSIVMGSGAATINVNRVSGSNATNTFVFNNLTLGSGQLDIVGANNYNVRFGGTTTLNANATINTNNTIVSLVGTVGGGFGLTKLGAVALNQAETNRIGFMTLSGTNTYSGVTTVAEGALVVNSAAPHNAAGALGNSTTSVLLGNNTGSATAYLLANNFVVGRNIVVQSGNNGTAYLGSASTSNSGETTYSGTVTLGSANDIGHGVSLVTGAFHTVNFNGVIQDPTNLSGAPALVKIVDANPANGLSGTFSPNPTNSSSNYVIAATNTYAGGTVIDTSGSVRIANTQAFGTGNLSIVRGTITQNTAVAALTGISGMTWDGNFTLNSFNNAPQGAVNLGTAPITLTGNRIVSVANNTSTVGGAISGTGRSLQVNGGSSTAGLTLNGASSFDGGLTVVGSTGALTVSSGNASAFGTGPLNLTISANSRVALNTNTTVGSLTSGINSGIAVAGGGTSSLAAGTYQLTIAGGDGATGTATVNASGVVTAAAITGLGSNFTATPTISLANSTATFTPTAFGSSSINLNPGTARTLTIAGTNASPAVFSGVISGANGALVKNGTGVQTLTGANTYTGSTTINAGVLNVDGSLAATSAVTVANTGKLGGSGSVGNVVVDAGGTINAGNSPGLLDTLSLTVNGTLQAEVNGTTVESQYDQVNVTGTVTLGNASLLDFVLGYAPAENDSFVLINNDGSDLITTMFNGLAEGGIFSKTYLSNTYQFQITYAGGTNGNDVVVTNVVPEPASLSLLGLGAAAFLRRRRR